MYFVFPTFMSAIRAIKSVIGDPGRHAAMSQAALAGVTRYSPDAERERLAAAFAGIPGRA